MGEPFDFSYVWSFLPKLLSTLSTTLLIVVSSLLAGIIVGFIVALPRLYKVPVLRTLSEIYISFFRGTPILIQLFLFYYGLPEILKLVQVDVTRAPVLVFVILTYGLHTGAYMSEMIRASVTAVDKGQVEAAYAAGMTGYQAFTRIVLPQALAIAVPVFSNLVIALLKDTSLAFTLGVMEMTGKAQTLGAVTQHFIETYIALALIYLVISFSIEKLLGMAEHRLLRHEDRNSPVKKTFGIHRNRSYRRIIAEMESGKGGVGL
ncbi:L-cystine transport system permease protein TcyL [Paenibacillus albidus]|uniref:L-cystine transport system permease protein TcyL n=1 Tax=Paenibacillus albidus TaxID=2041023 RepID=A0A917CAS2_9BACL|nr:amino acid ABC transporter permease [Paenibacillus albidus]GGF81313.1 L-cystine transport system permease protein TcyL [Paenibacillus albidus]